MQSEKWRDVVSHPTTYEVSSFGRLKNKRTGAFIAGHRTPKGYVVVCLCEGGTVTRSLLHRVVAAAWIGQCPEGYQVDHIDGSTSFNAVTNLRYLTPAQNRLATVARGAHAFGERNGQTKLTVAQVLEIRRTASSGKRYWGAKMLAARLNVDESNIRRAADGRSFTSVLL